MYPWRRTAGPDSSGWTWNFDRRTIRRLEHAVSVAAETVPPDASLFVLARKLIAIAGNRNDFECVARSWADFWEACHPDRKPIDRSEMLAKLETLLRRVQQTTNPLQAALQQTADPATWPKVDGESDRLRRCLAVCERLGSAGRFFVPTRDLGYGIGCSHVYAGRLLRRLITIGFITRTGERTSADCPYYELGPCFSSPEIRDALRKPAALRKP